MNPPHSVAKGDTLWRISIREYRDPLNWPSIFMENKDKIDNPDMIYPAQEFRIPANPEYRFPDYPKEYKRSR
ncbi:MAG: LysM peptidoglycan-binding domain-containing protein [SAR324 cluster bacterium]|nr:LysM peptidoglycan-binding domain-containing protein [SAR324 cluster bacterium]